LNLPADLCRQLAIRFLTATAALDLDVDRRVSALPRARMVKPGACVGKGDEAGGTRWTGGGT